MLVYATVADLLDEPWGITSPPAHAGRLLAYASRLVRRATMTAVYAVDDGGAPTSSGVAAAFRDATCSQVVAWLTAGIDPAGGAVQLEAAPVRAKRLGSGAVEYDTAASASVTAMTARAAAATTLAGDAYLILADAGLTSTRPGATR